MTEYAVGPDPVVLHPDEPELLEVKEGTVFANGKEIKRSLEISEATELTGQGFIHTGPVPAKPKKAKPKKKAAAKKKQKKGKEAAADVRKKQPSKAPKKGGKKK
jgi:hypothetical protein